MFEIRGWDIERFVPEYVREMIDRAAERSMNAIGLSHEICMNVEEILYDWHRYRHLDGFCRRAHGLGMRTYLWTHEINGPVERWLVDDDDKPRLDADDVELYEWIAAKYAEAAAKVPSCDGFILSLTESRIQVHRENAVRSTASPAERMSRVITAVSEGCASEGKRLIVRDFLRSPAEIDAFTSALANVSEDVWVYTKCVPNDWQYCYPPHPLLGKLAPRVQIMELDLATEVGGISRWPMCIPDYIQRMLRLARDGGLAGAIARCDDGFATNRGTPNEINIVAYTALVNDPDADVDATWREFCSDRYGKNAAAVAEAVLRRSFEIGCKLQYTLGFWTGAGPKFPTIAYTDGHLARHSTAIWDPGEENKRIERLLTESGPDAVEATVAEKNEAAKLSRQCLSELDAAKETFREDDYLQLRGYYERTLRDAGAGRVWARAYFALRWYRNTRSTQARRELETALEGCRNYERQAAALPDPGDVDALRRFISEVQAAADAV